jgi:integrase
LLLVTIRLAFVAGTDQLEEQAGGLGLKRDVAHLVDHPAKLTVDQYLDRWLTHIRSSLRARTVARYTSLLRDHVRPCLGARPLKQLTPLEIQAAYDRLAVGGRKDHKPGGLAPQHILAVHRCLHRALAQAVTWRLVTHNAATHATPPPVPHHRVVALAPEQVAVLLDAADQAPSPWLGSWTVLAAATGARNGELCGLEWADLDLDAGTVRICQALTIVDPAVLPNAAAAVSVAAGGGVGGRRKELAVGPLESAASSAILTLPAFAVQALRRHRRQQLRLRLAVGQPATVALRSLEPGRPPRPVELDLVFRHRARHAGQPQPRQPRLRPAGRRRRAGRPPAPAAPRAGVGDGANKEPASIIAAQLRHADGGALAQRVYIHQLPQTAPRLAGLVEGVFGPSARDTQVMPRVSAGRRVEGTGASNPA